MLLLTRHDNFVDKGGEEKLIKVLIGVMSMQDAALENDTEIEGMAVWLIRRCFL
jgi:hypothetical protein